MQYINPFDLLGIHTFDHLLLQHIQTADISFKAQQSNAVYGNHILTEQDWKKAIDSLQKEPEASFHWLVYQNPTLLQFLKSGNLSYFQPAQPKVELQDPAFQSFIGPYFAPVFDAVYSEAFQKRQLPLLLKLTQNPALLLTPDRHLLFQQVENLLRKQLEDLRVFNHNIADHYPTVDAHSIHQNILVGLHLQTLNTLPVYFESYRNEIALTIKKIALWIYNNDPAGKDITLELIRWAYQLRRTDLAKAEIDRLHHKLFPHYEIAQSIQPDQTKMQVQEMVQQLKTFRKEVQHNTLIKDEVIKGDIDAILDIESVNALPKSLVSLKDKVAKLLAQIAFAFWEKRLNKDLLVYYLDRTADIQLDTPYQVAIRSFQEKANSKEVAFTQDLETVLYTLVGLKDNIQQIVRSEEIGFDAQQIVFLLEDIMKPELLQAVAQPKHRFAHKQLTEHLIPILHHLRRFKPMALLDFLDHIKLLTSYDTYFQGIYQRIENQLLNELEAGVLRQQPGEPALQQQNVRRLPDPNFSQEWLNQLVINLYKFKYFIEEKRERGPARSVQLLVIASLGCIVFVFGGVMMTTLTSTYEVEMPDKKSLYEQRNVIPKYERMRSFYEGNQLKNGEMPFRRCFGFPHWDAQSSNRLTIQNKLLEDAVAVVFDAETKETIAHAYIQSLNKYTFKMVPDGKYRIRFYIGKDWNPYKPNFCGLHGAFDTNPHYVILTRRESPINIQGGVHPKIDLHLNFTGDHKRFPPLSARGFFYNKQDVEATE